MSVVGLFSSYPQMEQKTFDNYIEIYIKSSIDKITRYDQRGIYKRKKLQVLILLNRFQKNHIYLYLMILKKIKNIMQKKFLMKLLIF